ncbi:hypothetical protein HMPREF2630_07305 [Rothia sp. HMSC072B03]|nr:hypothetical protein HMPREF2630_07305 [Rothia sp. HMSC072B03]
MLRINGKFPEPGDHAMFLKNLPPPGYTFYLRAAMIIVLQTQYFCILCTQKPRERIHARGAFLYVLSML